MMPEEGADKFGALSSEFRVKNTGFVGREPVWFMLFLSKNRQGRAND